MPDYVKPAPPALPSTPDGPPARLRYDHPELNRLRAEVARLRDHLAEVTERRDLALRAACAGVWDWRDVGAEDVHFSTGMLSLLGYGSEEVEHTVDGFWALIHEDDRPRVREVLARTLEAATRFDVSYRIRFRDRGYRWVRSTGTPVRDDDGRTRRLTGSIADVHEAEAHRLELEAAAERYDRLRALVHEELSEPLRHVEAICALIEEDGPCSPDARAYVTTLRKSAQRALRVAEEMARV